MFSESVLVLVKRLQTGTGFHGELGMKEWIGIVFEGLRYDVNKILITKNGYPSSELDWIWRAVTILKSHGTL